MKKNKRLFFALAFFGIFVFLAGVFTLALGVIDNFDDPQITRQTILLLKIFGICGVTIGVALIAFGLFNYAKGNRELVISEKDERNIAIRGKAAQITCLFTSFLLLALCFVFIAMELLTAALLVGAAMLISSFFQMLIILYFDKKM